MTAAARVLRPPRLHRPALLDAVLAVAFVVMNTAEVLVNRDVGDASVHLLYGGLGMVALAWRRQAPLLVTTAVVLVNLLTNPQNEFSTLLSLVLVCFTVGAETEPPRSYLGLAMPLVGFVGSSVVHGMVPSDLAAALVFFVGPWFVGGALRGRTETTEAAVARAERLEAERELEAARAAAEERTRIARELHDIVSHSISVVTIQTQAVRRRLGPENAAEAADLAAVEATARDALAEMRRLFGVLRTEGEQASLAPQPGLSELDRLVAQVGTGDLVAMLRVEGEPVGLPPGVDLAAYRIAQEGLTNAVRHSGASRVEVLVRYEPGVLHVEVDDDGRGLPAGPATGGHGLVGIRERVGLYDGHVELTASPLGGVRLSATLPLKETP